LIACCIGFVCVAAHLIDRAKSAGVTGQKMGLLMGSLLRRLLRARI
jgi:hypothetical protein